MIKVDKIHVCNSRSVPGDPDLEISKPSNCNRDPPPPETSKGTPSAINGTMERGEKGESLGKND